MNQYNKIKKIVEKNNGIIYAKDIENKGYNVYFTGVRFVYQNANRLVQPNELMIAIKEK